MSLVLTIPDEILETIKLPKKQIEKELKKELVFLLYERELVSMGVSRRLAGLTKWEFIEGLAERGMQRHYDEKELEEDIRYAKGS
jgi:predicted HTH domain antitoxin